MPVVSSADHEPSQQYDERHVSFSLEFLCTLDRSLIITEFKHGLYVLWLVEIERSEENWVYHSCVEHAKRHNSVDNRASCDFLRCSFALWVFVGEHLEASPLVVILIFVENTVKMRELPWEDVGGKECSLRAKSSSSLRHSSNKGWKWADNGADKSVPRRGLFHRDVNAKIREPNQVGNHPCIWCKLGVGEEGHHREASADDATVLWSYWKLGDRSVFSANHWSIFVSFYNLAKALSRHGNCLSCKKESERWHQANSGQGSMIKEHGVCGHWVKKWEFKLCELH